MPIDLRKRDKSVKFAAEFPRYGALVVRLPP